MVVRMKRNLALIIGGLTLMSKESQRVFKVDWDKKDITECEPLEKGICFNSIFFRWSSRKWDPGWFWWVSSYIFRKC